MNNTVLNPGAGGDTIATDDIGGIKYQRIKVNFGADGTASNVSVANPLPVARAPAANAWGQALALTAGETGTIASIPAAATGYQITGFIAHGTGDGYWSVQVDSITVLSGRTRAAMPCLTIMLPNGIAVTPGSMVALKITNESGSTADYEATMLGT